MNRYNHGNPCNLFQEVPIHCKHISFCIHSIIITDIIVIDNNSVLYENIQPINTTVQINSKKHLEHLISECIVWPRTWLAWLHGPLGMEIACPRVCMALAQQCLPLGLMGGLQGERSCTCVARPHCPLDPLGGLQGEHLSGGRPVWRDCASLSALMALSTFSILMTLSALSALLCLLILCQIRDILQYLLHIITIFFNYSHICLKILKSFLFFSLFLTKN